MQNNISNNEIKRYVEGKMSSTEKHSFEKEALENPMLQDAVEGYQNTPSGFTRFENIKPPRKPYLNSTSKIILLSAITLGVILIYNTFRKPVNIETNEIATIIDNDSVYQEIEILPLELDTLVNIIDKEQIHQQTLSNDHKSNPKFDKGNYVSEAMNETKPDNHKIDLIEVSPVDIENEEVFVNSNPKKIYPFVYFHELAVVDYTKFENRTKTITKTKYVYTGLSANHESESSKNTTEMTEQIVDVSYMEYLEESMWYFSKERYKNALKRYDVIAGQYKNDLNALFYGGLSNYNLGRFEFALKNFTAIVNLGDSPFYEDAEWYKVKTEIKLGKKDAARYNLQSIISDGGYYSKDAILLLKKM